jgi:hypothetical protein
MLDSKCRHPALNCRHPRGGGGPSGTTESLGGSRLCGYGGHSKATRTPDFLRLLGDNGLKDRAADARGHMPANTQI